MELKKNPNVDVRSIRVLLLLIGSIVTLLTVCIVMAISFTESEKKVSKDDAKVIDDEEIVVTRQEEKKIEPPKVQKVEIKVYSDVLKIVTNEEKVETESVETEPVETEPAETESKTQNGGEEDFGGIDISGGEDTVEEKGSETPFLIACIALICLSIASIVTVIVIRAKEKA